jgi:hypothetical protein
MSLYDTLSSFTTMLLGSVVTDSMTDSARVQFMASGKVVNFVCLFAVASHGLAIFAGRIRMVPKQNMKNDVDNGKMIDTSRILTCFKSS